MAEEHTRKREDGRSPMETITLITLFLRAKGDSSFTDVLLNEKGGLNIDIVKKWFQNLHQRLL